MDPSKKTVASPNPNTKVTIVKKRVLKYVLHFGVSNSHVSALPYQLPIPQSIMDQHQSDIQYAAHYIVCGYSDKAIRVWNWHDGQQVSSGLAHFDRINGLTSYWDPKLNRFLYFSAGDRRIIAWYLDHGGKFIRHEKSLPGHNNHTINCIISGQLSPQPMTDYRPRVISSGLNDIKVWDFENPKRKHLLALPMSHVTSMFCHERQLWCGTFDGSVKVWDLEHSNLIGSIQIGECSVTSINRQSETGKIVISTWDNTMAVISTNRIEIENKKSNIQAPYMTCNDEFIVACGHDGHIRLFDSQLKDLQILKAHQASASAIVNVKSNSLISGGFDGALNVWRL